MLLIITSIVGIIREIIILVIVVLIVRWITSFFTTPNRNTQNNAGSNYSQKQNETSGKMNTQKNKSTTSKQGEYVDYEEVE